MNYRDPNGVRYVLGQIAEEQKQLAAGHQVVRNHRRRRHQLAARMRTANAMAKQGKLDEARAYLKRVDAETPAKRRSSSVAEAQLLREANRNRDAYDCSPMR